MILRIWRRLTYLVAIAALVLASCGSGDDDAEATGDSDATGAASGADGDRPTIVVTTNILGDVVGEIVGDQAEVITIMPVGADPHDFQASAQEVDQLLAADALIVNGENFEEGLVDVIDSAGDEGVPTYEAIDAVSTIEFGAGGHDHHSDEEHSDHSDEEHSDEEHSDEEHDHSDEEHSDEEHSDHSDEEHSDEEHSDEEHSDEEHDHSDRRRSTRMRSTRMRSIPTRSIPTRSTPRTTTTTATITMGPTPTSSPTRLAWPTQWRASQPSSKPR